jgi:hypothetical protein
MTTHSAPQFRTHSNLRATLRGAALVTIASALIVGFLAEVWTAPAHRELRSAPAAMIVRA